MASMVRSFDRKMKREGKEIQIVKGVKQYTKVSDKQKHAPRSKKFKSLAKLNGIAGEK